MEKLRQDRRSDERIPQNVGRITETRQDPEWGAAPQTVKHLSWFDQHPYESAILSTGHQTDRQWYTYNATSLVVKGACDYAILAASLEQEQLFPVRNRDGDAMAAIWLNIIKDSVCGVYHEVVISIDATSRAEETPVDSATRDAPLSYLYNFFGSRSGERSLLHTLLINSPLSIAWGREMQAFPKHPKPVQSRLEETPQHFQFDIKWNQSLVMCGQVGKRWGLRPFLLEGYELMFHFNPINVCNFLARPTFTLPISMPQKTAHFYQLKRDYVASFHKGLNPVSVRVWPWAVEDELCLGDTQQNSGCEENNGHCLLKAANFKPKVCIYMPVLQAFVA